MPLYSDWQSGPVPGPGADVDQTAVLIDAEWPESLFPILSFELLGLRSFKTAKDKENNNCNIWTRRVDFKVANIRLKIVYYLCILICIIF